MILTEQERNYILYNGIALNVSIIYIFKTKSFPFEKKARCA